MKGKNSIKNQHLLLFKLVVSKNDQPLFSSLTSEALFGASQILKHLINGNVFLHTQNSISNQLHKIKKSPKPRKWVKHSWSDPLPSPLSPSRQHQELQASPPSSQNQHQKKNSLFHKEHFFESRNTLGRELCRNQRQPSWKGEGFKALQKAEFEDSKRWGQPTSSKSTSSGGRYSGAFPLIIYLFIQRIYFWKELM